MDMQTSYLIFLSLFKRKRPKILIAKTYEMNDKKLTLGQTLPDIWHFADLEQNKATLQVSA